jgi:hypothetical protein
MMANRLVQHRPGHEARKEPIEEVEPMRPLQRKRQARKHKPVVDLYAYHPQNTPKFDLLSRANQSVKHVYVGNELDTAYDREMAKDGTRAARTWDRDGSDKRYATGEYQQEARKMRREASSEDVLKWLRQQGSGSINRINIDYSFPQKAVLSECMRVLEPGGAVEVGTLEYYREDAERTMREMGLGWREGRPTRLDMSSDFLMRHWMASRYQALDKLVKYVIEKPGGDASVDRRSFWERLTEKERMQLR